MRPNLSVVWLYQPNIVGELMIPRRRGISNLPGMVVRG